MSRDPGIREDWKASFGALSISRLFYLTKSKGESMTDLRNKPVENLFRIRFQNAVGDCDSEIIEKKEADAIASFDLSSVKEHIEKIKDIVPLRPGNGWKITECTSKAQFILQLFDEHFSFSMNRTLKDYDSKLFNAINTLDSVIDQMNIAKEELQMHLSYATIKES
jgi:hypothetical protein